MLNDNKLIIVSDIEKFYPSVVQEKVKKIFNDKLNNSDIPNVIKELATKLLNDLCSFFPNGVGITTGSEFSHVIGDLALQNIDKKLGEKYGDGYFRYVDDIVLIVDPNEKYEAIKLLESLAGDEGLTINPEKNDVLTNDSWLNYGPHNEHKVKSDSFEALLFKDTLIN